MQEAAFYALGIFTGLAVFYRFVVWAVVGFGRLLMDWISRAA